MKTLITGGIVVNEGHRFIGSVVIEGDRISEITEDTKIPRGGYDEIVDATGCFVIPGVIDEHVHFREPGLTAKADIATESRAAAYGGVTSYFDMPNTKPQTTSADALEDKFERARKDSCVNYSFFYGATNGNYAGFGDIDFQRVPGIKLFMGASTGNMLVDKYGSLLEIFRSAASLGVPVMAHCEDTDIICRNMEQMKKAYGEDPAVMLHPVIRSEEACYESSALAAQLARTFGTKLHIAHISTEKELSLLGGDITGEACIAHLFFSSDDYLTKGALIKCNPAIKKAEDRDALRRAAATGIIETIGTDHAPHLLSEKQGGCCKAVSGMPLIQFSLVTMLELVDSGVLTMEQMVALMCHNPARLFGVRGRGYLRCGYKADIAIVRRCGEPWTLTNRIVQSKCGWSPLSGHEYDWCVEHTFCNGHHIYNKGVFDDTVRGEEIAFR